jgi:hypothetical protein
MVERIKKTYTCLSVCPKKVFIKNDCHPSENKGVDCCLFIVTENDSLSNVIQVMGNGTGKRHLNKLERADDVSFVPCLSF